MKLAINMIRMDLTELIHRSPSLFDELNIIYQLNSAPVSRSCLEGMTLDVIEQVLARPTLGWIHRRTQASPERALLGVVNGDHVVAIPLVSVSLTVSNLVGLAELLQLPEDFLHPFVEIMVATSLLFEGDFELVVNDQRLEPCLLEPVDVLVVRHSEKSMKEKEDEWWLMGTGILRRRASHVKDNQSSRDAFLAMPSDSLQTMDLVSIDVGINFGRPLIKGLYFPINEMLTIINCQEQEQDGRFVLPLAVEGESDSSEIIVYSVGNGSELLAWK